MALKFFTITVRDSTQGEQEVNAFLSSHRVIAVDRRFIDQGENSFWTVCVDYMPTVNGQGAITYGERKGRVDYREVLSPEDFVIFAKLRTLRKQLAQAESVPVYMIFTNEQLAEMVRRRAASNADLEAIAGVGDSRITKYGLQFLEAIKLGPAVRRLHGLGTATARAGARRFHAEARRSAYS